jgi:hypothetical protein
MRQNISAKQINEIHHSEKIQKYSLDYSDNFYHKILEHCSGGEKKEKDADRDPFRPITPVSMVAPEMK